MCIFAGEKEFNIMVYDKHIDKTEDALCELREVYSSNEVDRFIDGLESGRINSEEKVIKFTNFIRSSDGLTQLEFTRLKRLQDEGFIEKFATNYNKRYSTCHMLMDKMRSGISRGIQMLEKLCDKTRSRRQSKPKRKVSHPEAAHEKHRKSRQEVLLNSRSVVKRLVDMNVEMENDLMKKVEAWKQEKKSIEEISALLYHELDENEYNDWVISEEVMAARRQGITNQERALWGDDKQQVMRCRTAYSHIDELNPEGQKGRIGGVFLALLHKWSKVQPSRGVEYWLTYFTDFYTTNGGKLKPVKLGAVKKGLTQIVKAEVTKKEVDEFNEAMDNLVKKHMKNLSE